MLFVVPVLGLSYICSMAITVIVCLPVCLSASPLFTWGADWFRASGAELKHDPMTLKPYHPLQPREAAISCTTVQVLLLLEPG